VITSLLLTIAAQVPEPSPPPDAREAPAVAAMPPAFFDQALVWDSATHAPRLGREKKTLTRFEFYERVGRPDLVALSRGAMNRRIGFAIAAGALAVGGVIAGVLMLSKATDMNSAFCVDNVDNYNRCTASNRFQQIGGTAFIAAGLGSAMLLTTIAYWQKPDVVDHDEAIHLVSQYNATMLKKLRAVPSSLRWMPAFGPQGGMLAVSGQF